jgi:hypothetical protein
MLFSVGAGVMWVLVGVTVVVDVLGRSVVLVLQPAAIPAAQTIAADMVTTLRCWGCIDQSPT